MGTRPWPLASAPTACTCLQRNWPPPSSGRISNGPAPPATPGRNWSGRQPWTWTMPCSGRYGRLPPTRSRQVWDGHASASWSQTCPCPCWLWVAYRSATFLLPAPWAPMASPPFGELGPLESAESGRQSKPHRSTTARRMPHRDLLLVGRFARVRLGPGHPIGVRRPGAEIELPAPGRAEGPVGTLRVPLHARPALRAFHGAHRGRASRLFYPHRLQT